MKQNTPLALAGLAALLLSFGAHAQEQTQAQPKLPTIQLNADIHNIPTEVARTPDQRATGMMFRTTMGTNDAMLFVFEEPNVQCFWMKNTLVPLSAAFIKDDGTIANIADMKPQTTDSHCSTEPERYVLEMNQGWFAKRGVKAGSKLRGAPFTK
ncbi:MAG: hypothetical protein JWP52_4333 [Rhizobacter sp.]|nr:hypothetical protein [Rhizobacter sp.]